MGLLTVSSLRVEYPDAAAPAVDELDFSLAPGEAVGIVGESGSGKTQTALAIAGLLSANARITGSVRIAGTEVIGASPRALKILRPRRLAMVFQDPMAALNPYMRIGDQLRRILLHHGLCRRRDAAMKAVAMLERVGLPDPERQYRAWPHQLSGGMRQRALIASALIAGPDLLVADEPTTALDVTVQAQILALLEELRRESGTALLLITHDLGVIAGNCERMLVLDGGRLVESGRTADLFAKPSHPRTVALLAAHPKLDGPCPAPPAAGDEGPLLHIADVSVSFRERRRGGRNRLQAVRPFTLDVAPGETVAIVGESGSGKTSLARAVLGLIPRQSGEVAFLGRFLPPAVQSRPNAVRRELQMVFQDPVASLDPAMQVASIIAEPVRLHDRSDQATAEVVAEMLERVGLAAELGGRYPHELSGGQAQRVAIARALVMQPKLLICDEAVAALDGSVRSGILELLQAEQQRSSLSLIMITHDLGVVRCMSHRVLVMYLGRICEIAGNDALFRRPRHPYTRALIDAVPVPDPAAIRGEVIPGEAASILNPPAGCIFHPRCRFATDRCRTEVPALERLGQRQVACHHAAELQL